MKAFRFCLGFAVVPALTALFAVPAAAHADTYQIFYLGAENPTDFLRRIDVVGITASGTAVLVYYVPAGAPLCATSHLCREYETWVHGVMVDYSANAPNLVYDNGSSCTVRAPFLTSAVQGVCNNGHEVYNAGLAAEIPYTGSTFTGPDPATDLFASSPLSVEEVSLNSSGDFVYNISHPTGGSGVDAEAIDLTTETPEPSGICLLGTGLLALAETLRRNRSGCSHGTKE